MKRKANESLKKIYPPKSTSFKHPQTSVNSINTTIPLKNVFTRLLKDITNKGESQRSDRSEISISKSSHIRNEKSSAKRKVFASPLSSYSKKPRLQCSPSSSQKNKSQLTSQGTNIEKKQRSLKNLMKGCSDVPKQQRMTKRKSSDSTHKTPVTTQTNKILQAPIIDLNIHGKDQDYIQEHFHFSEGEDDFGDHILDYSSQEDANLKESEENNELVSAPKFDIQKILKKVRGRKRSDSSSSPASTTKNKICYLDHGDPMHMCDKCGAIMWLDERINKRRKTTKPIFTMCCLQGTVKIPFLKKTPEYLRVLLRNDDELSRHFRANLRPYNMIFAFTSLGGKVDRSMPKGRGPKMFQLHGQNYHLMGSLKPEDGDYPKCSQLYIVDTENEVENRATLLSKGKNNENVKKKNNLRKEIIEPIMKMLDEVNPYVEAFRQAKDKFDTNEEATFHMRIVSDRKGKDGRTHSMPTASEVAALIPGDFHPGMPERDIIVEEKSGKLQRISKIHPSYLALQYPLLFPYGEDGFRPNIQKGFTGVNKNGKPQNVSMRQFFAFRIQERAHESHTHLHSKRLFQQFLVDAYTTIEASRLKYIRFNQSKLRGEKYDSLKEMLASGNSNMGEKGNRLLLPASFVGGPRYMQQLYYDAMAICKHFGFPDLFITFTCNPKWPEITRFLKNRNLNYDDRPDIVCRIFKMKLDSLMHDLTKGNLLGKTISAMYTVEFQKRGLPHAHIVLFMHPSCKFPTADSIDGIICAEIPDKNSEPELYEVVKDCMIHGPCGAANPASPCMVDGKCSKFYPKPNVAITKVDNDGFPVYRRRQSTNFVEKNGFTCDNRYVVPYNKDLSLRYKAHINVEWCNQSGSIKYLFKYINKGQDHLTVSVERGKKKSSEQQGNEGENEEEKPKNEIRDFFDCRYVSPSEAVWRILKFPLNFRSTPVEKLKFHLEGQHMLFYKESDDVETVLNRKSAELSQFLGWFKLNMTNSLARTLTYEQIPNYFTYDPKEKKFNERKLGFSIGRIGYASRKIEDEYYLRILLNIVKGPTSFDEIRTYRDVVYKSYKEACYARGLLEDDQAYVDSIISASLWCFGDDLRRFFALMLDADCLSVPENVWEKTWHILSEDIEQKKRKEYNNKDLNLNEAQKRNFALQEIEECLLRNGTTLERFTSMPQPSREEIDHSNRLIVDETSYDCDLLREQHEEWIKMLTSEQKDIYDEITDAVLHNRGGVFFVYGFGGTGKTFMWKTISAAIRSNGSIVLNVASSGIASLLLEGGRTAHSRFAIPINPDDYTLCRMKPGSDLANLVKQASLIIWDEAPMMSRYCFESLDRSLSDIIVNPENKPFAGKVVVFGGDFRQVLPVINGAGRTEIVMAALNSSYLWEHCKVLKLTKNMRLLSNNLSVDEAKEIEEFSNWLLDVGDGKIAEPNDCEALIDIPSEFLITEANDPIEVICRKVYGDLALFQETKDPKFFQERAILCPTNIDVDVINEYMVDQLAGDERIYLSADSIDPMDTASKSNPIFTPDFLHSINVSGLPKHSLRLKKGTPVMLLRNIDTYGGLCNGTRLQVTQMDDHVLQATVITGRRVGETVLIPKIAISPSDTKLPFKMRRRQFPLNVAFAMTINKSQGQSLNEVGVFLPRPVFSHGQLYVALSRVTSKKGLKLLIVDKEGKPEKKTMNVVFKEVFQNL